MKWYIDGTAKQVRRSPTQAGSPTSILLTKLLQHQPVRREARHFTGVRQIQFIFNMGAVRFHGFLAQVQSPGDIVHVMSFSD